MTHGISIRRIGNSYGLILGKSTLESLGLGEGDKLFVVRTPDGIRLTPYDPEFADAVHSARRYMRRHRNAMRKLAK